MAYLSSKIDVFVSYSHGDPDGAGHSPLRDWTVDLVGQLKAIVKALDPEFEDLEIWCDPQIDPTCKLTPTLKEKVKSAGILIVVMSKHYLKSSWCKDELQWFAEEVRGRDPERVFVVRSMPTNGGEWPEFLCDDRGHTQIGFPFHAPEMDEPFCFNGSNETRDQYTKALRDLRVVLTQRLRTLREREEARAQQARGKRKPGAARVYLYARASDAAAHGEICQALFNDGLRPVGALEGDGLHDSVKAGQDRWIKARWCDALALLRTDDDKTFADVLFDIGFSERDAIQRERGYPLACAVLDRTGSDLPIEISTSNIKRFDLQSEHWRNSFKEWLEMESAC